jgi:hypothetical protein
MIAWARRIVPLIMAVALGPGSADSPIGKRMVASIQRDSGSGLGVRRVTMRRYSAYYLRLDLFLIDVGRQGQFSCCNHSN